MYIGSEGVEVVSLERRVVFIYVFRKVGVFLVYVRRYGYNYLVGEMVAC